MERSDVLDDKDSWEKPNGESSKSKYSRKWLLLGVNVLVLVLLFFMQGQRYQELIRISNESIDHKEVILKAGILTQNGSAINWITGICAVLLIVNMILYRNWINAKRWIIEPLLIFVLCLVLSLYYQINMTKGLAEQIFN